MLPESNFESKTTFWRIALVKTPWKIDQGLFDVLKMRTKKIRQTRRNA
jgi:hypothetical protein